MQQIVILSHINFLYMSQEEAGIEPADSFDAAEVAAQLAKPSGRHAIDAAAAEQVLQDIHRDGTSALPESWVTPMGADALVPQMQTMLRYFDTSRQSDKPGFKRHTYL